MLQTLKQWFFPYTCALCKKKSTLLQDLCAICYKNLPWIKEACHRCGQPLEKFASFCGACLKSPPVFDTALALFRYEPPIDNLIKGLKFHHRLLYAKLLGELFAEKLSQTQRHFPEVIIPVPLHPQRLKERGFNQAIELARPIAKKLQIPMESKLCKRVRMTAPQSSISAKQRSANVKNAFAVDATFTAKHVALIDDVITTGQTLQALTMALRDKGICQIEVWVCAKVPLSS